MRDSNLTPEETRRYWMAVIVTRSTELSATEKLLYRKMTELDRPEGRRRPGGCFASAETLGEEIGMSVRTVKAARARLCRLGLLWRESDAKGMNRWFPRLPDGVDHRALLGAQDDEMDTRLRALTEQFDMEIATAAHRERIERRVNRSLRRKPRLELAG